MKRIILVGLILLLSACGTVETSTPYPTPESINIIYPQDLRAWVDKLSSCASQNPQMSLYLTQSVYTNTNTLSSNIVLDFGQVSLNKAGTFISQIGWDQVVVVINKENPTTQLSKDELLMIYSGQNSRWENDTHAPIQVWVLPEADPARIIFDHALLSSETLTSAAMLAPDPDAMLEAISKDVNSIGYGPYSLLNSSDSTVNSKYKTIQLDSALEAELRQPVIAITQNEPEGQLRNLLVCLQDSAP